MVIDSSALVAILLGEPEAQAFAEAIEKDATRLLSVANALESSIVIEARWGEAGSRELDLLIHRAQIKIVSMESGQLEIARNAWRKYGKGRHKAKLNFCDCCAYALSRYSGEFLLFKGQDFIYTDVQSVVLTN